jgi:hypothetical protein
MSHRIGGQTAVPRFKIGTTDGPKDSSPEATGTIRMLTKERQPAARSLRGSAINVLHEAGAIRECEEHGWMQGPRRSARY